MAPINYGPSLDRVLSHEGGYTNHLSDPGGPTNFGITIFDYRKYVMPSATADDVRAMRLSEAKAIYRAKYWDALRCDDLEPGVDYAVFDYGVNSGVGRAGKVLRRLVSLPDDSSAVTDGVIRAANAMPAADMITRMCGERLRFLKGLQTWPVFGSGWGRRVAEVKQYALSIASDIPIVNSPPIAPASGRAIDSAEFSRVRALQQKLQDAGFDPGAIDGDLGPKTVKAFQKSIGLMPDGIVGRLTKPLLDKALS